MDAYYYYYNYYYQILPHHFLSLFQPKRLGALNKFKAGERSILICTDVASRGLDIPAVDVVINYDIPMNSKVSYFLSEKGSLFFLHQEVLYLVHVIAHAYLLCKQALFSTYVAICNALIQLENLQLKPNQTITKNSSSN